VPQQCRQTGYWQTVYASTLGNVRTHLAREKLAIQPRRRRWHDLFLTLKAIEQEL